MLNDLHTTQEFSEVVMDEPPNIRIDPMRQWTKEREGKKAEVLGRDFLLCQDRLARWQQCLREVNEWDIPMDVAGIMDQIERMELLCEALLEAQRRALDEARAIEGKEGT